MSNKFSLEDGEGWLFNFVGHLACVVVIPLVIMRHLWHLWCVLLSTLAVLFAGIVSVITGQYYPQYVSFMWDDPHHHSYDEMPEWFIWFSPVVNNHITTFHRWLVELVSYVEDDDSDDDDWEGGEAQEFDGHELLKDPQ